MRAISGYASAHLLSALVLVTLFASPTRADDEQDQPDKEDIIAEALDHRVSLEVDQASLTDVLAFFSDVLPQGKQISIVLDRRSIADAGIDIENPVSLKVSGIRFRSALGLILEEAGLDWTVNHEVLLITTKEAARANMIARVYSVDDVVVQQGDPDRTPQFDALIELIQNEIAPESWNTAGGVASIHHFGINGNRIVVRQTPQVHYEVARLLDELRGTAQEEPADAQPSADTPQESDGKTPAKEERPATKEQPATEEQPAKDEKPAPEDTSGAGTTGEESNNAVTDNPPAAELTVAAEEMVCPRNRR